MSKVAVIGDPSSVLAFTALGLQVFSPEGEVQIRNRIDHCAREGFAVIYITERYAQLAEETIERYKTQPIPAIILIPDSQGSLGIGMEEISKNVQKAVGMDIF